MRSFLTRTKLATAAAVVAIGITGAVAVGANVGILDSASDTTTGKLSAAGDLVSPTSTVLDVYLDDAGRATATVPPATMAPSSTMAPRGTQEFTVDEAGVIRIVGSPDAVRLDSVAPTPGWRWTTTQTDAGALTATFTNGSRTLQFDASASSDGTISASVTEPVMVPVPADNAAPTAPSRTGSASSPNPTSFHEDDDDHDDDDDDGSDDDNGSGYEGSDDDD